MSEETAVFEYTATYYDQVVKKWISGEFKLNKTFISFTKNEQQTLKIPMNTISSLEKRQSSFIYAAVVVSVNAEKYWFASFTNRDSVYNLIELFWREALLSKDHKMSPAKPKSASTDLGKELLNILHESETTLVNAANALSDQGKQIEETQATVDDINSDLNIAENFLKNMSSFVPALQAINKVNTNLEAQHVTLKCFKVSYTFSENVTDNSFWDRGTILISDENISLLNDSKTNQFSVNYGDIISCQIISSWKLLLTYSINNTQNSCHIICPKLSKLLKCLNSSSIKNKIVISDDIPISSTSCCSGLSTSGSLNSLLSSPVRSMQNNELTQNVEQVQENCNMLSDEDIEEISNALSNLQSLAAEVSKEQQDQMEKINTLMSHAEKTELRMKSDTKKIKKLT